MELIRWWHISSREGLFCTPALSVNATGDGRFASSMQSFSASRETDYSLFKLQYSCNALLVIKVITVNQRGSLTLPKEAREKLGVSGGGQLVAVTNESGNVTLRAGVVLPVEIYSAARAKEFERMNELPLAVWKLRWRKAR